MFQGSAQSVGGHGGCWREPLQGARTCSPWLEALSRQVLVPHPFGWGSVPP